MEQTSWFDFTMESDPVYSELQRLHDESTVFIAPFTISENRYGLYEIEGPDSFDCCSSIEQCYTYICEHSKE